MKKFNTAGSSVAEDHHMIPPLSRFDLDEIGTLIEDKRYFILHAPRQTGKTTCLLALMAHLNPKGDYRTVYANVEPAQALRRQFESYGDDVASVRALGQEVVTRLCERLLAEGAPGLHFYSMNRAEPTVSICRALGLAPAGD